MVSPASGSQSLRRGFLILRWLEGIKQSSSRVPRSGISTLRTADEGTGPLGVKVDGRKGARRERVLRSYSKAALVVSRTVAGIKDEEWFSTRSGDLLRFCLVR